MRINVTQELIEAVRRRGYHKANDCPVALALREATGIEWGVGFCQSGFVRDGVYVAYPNPASVQAFVSEFDWERPVKPFSFKFDQQGGLSDGGEVC